MIRGEQSSPAPHAIDTTERPSGGYRVVEISSRFVGAGSRARSGVGAIGDRVPS